MQVNNIGKPIDSMTTSEILGHNNDLRDACYKLGSRGWGAINSIENNPINIAERGFLKGFTEFFFKYTSENDIPKDPNIVLEACKNGAKYARQEVVKRCENERQLHRELSQAA